jgi:hypothetical protein
MQIPLEGYILMMTFQTLSFSFDMLDVSYTLQCDIYIFQFIQYNFLVSSLAWFLSFPSVFISMKIIGPQVLYDPR